MNPVLLLLISSITCNVWTFLILRAYWRSEERCYQYAVKKSKEFDICDPASTAYSDMATTITLMGVRDGMG